MMSLTFGLFTQVSGSGPLGPLVFFSVAGKFCLVKTDSSHETLKVTSVLHKHHLRHRNETLRMILGVGRHTTLIVKNKVSKRNTAIKLNGYCRKQG